MYGNKHKMLTYFFNTGNFLAHSVTKKINFYIQHKLTNFKNNFYFYDILPLKTTFSDPTEFDPQRRKSFLHQTTQRHGR